MQRDEPGPKMVAAISYGRILLALVYSWGGMFIYADIIHACQATNVVAYI